MAKKRVAKDFDKLTKETQVAVRAEYPNGFAHKLITYTGPKGEKISALPFETDDTYYLIRMSVQEARTLSKEDDDFDDLTIGAVPSVGADVNFEDLDMADSSDDDSSGGGDDYNDDYDSGIISSRSRNDDDDDDDDY